MNKLDHPRKAISLAKKREAGKLPRTIRQQLEHDAWTRHYHMASRMARRPRQPEASLHVPRWSGSRRRLCRQDRVLLVMVILLLLLLLFARVSAAQVQTPVQTPAQEPASGNAAAHRGATDLSDSTHWGIEFRRGELPQLSTALDTDIKAEITGMVARVNVQQRFRNTGQAWSEAIYRFPLPAGAAVDRLLVEAGGRTIEGEIQEKQEANRQYQQARAEGMVAALVEQQRPNQFETRLANIGPLEEVTVSISFLAPVDYRDARFSLQIPLTFTPRYSPAESWESWSRQPAPAAPVPAFASEGGPGDPVDDHHLTLSIRLHSSMNFASVESRYHNMDMHPTLGGFDLYLADPDTRTDRVFELDWKPDFGPQPESALMTWDDGDAVYAMLMLAPPLEEALAAQAREVVFVLDTSGSMEGVSLQQATAALYQGLGQLEPGDRFNVIEFNDDSHVLFDQSVESSEASLVEAMDFIDELEANGGTNMEPALRDAMLMPAQPGLLRQIVFITDGSVGNEQQLLLQLADILGESRLFTISIGSAPNTWFMRKAAEIGRGSHTHIGKLEEVEARMSSLWQRIRHPALQDICVDWGMPAESYPEIIPDLYAGEPLWVFARLPSPPREVTLCGELDGQHWEQSSSLVSGAGSEELSTLWARARIEALEDSRMFGEDEELIRLQVTDVALQFNLVTPYTSLVAIDRTPVRQPGEKLGSSEIASLLPAGSSMNAVSFSSTATGWQAQLVYSLATLLSAASLLWFSTPSRRVQAGGSPRPLVHATELHVIENRAQ